MSLPRTKGSSGDITATAHSALAPRGVHAWLRQLRAQRCFLLLLALVLLLLGMPFVVGSMQGRAILGVLHVIVLASAVAAVRRSTVSIAIAVLLGLPMLGYQVLALETGLPVHFALSWGLGAVFYGYTIVHLLHYVLRQDTMTADKLYGAVAVYVMLALFWAFIFGVLQFFLPGAFAHNGVPKALDLGELIFFSFTVLTTAGFGDFTPAVIHSRFLTMFEAVTGVMYIAILIARLTGVYPVRQPTP